MKKNNIYYNALRLAIPIMLQSAVTNAVGLVDNVMIGSLGTESISAVSIAGQILFVFNMAIWGGMAGPGLYGAQYYGQKNTEGVRKVFRLKWWIAMAITAIGIGGIIIFGREFLSLYLQGDGSATEAELILTYGCDYLHIMLWGLLPFAATQIYAGSLRETGDSTSPMAAGFCAIGTDVVLNYLLIFGRLGFPAMGVKGAAAASVIARFVELIVIVICAHLRKRNCPIFNGAYKTFSVPLSFAKEAFVKGVPLFLNQFFMAAGMAFMTQCFSLRGMSLLPGMNIANAVLNLMGVVHSAIGSAVGILTGQTLGASRQEEARENSFRYMRFSFFICIGLAVLLQPLSKFFPLLYKTTDEVRSCAGRFIWLTALFFPVQGCLNTLYSILRAGGRTGITFLFDSIFTWMVTVPISLVLCRFTDISIWVIFILVQSADITKVIIGYVLVSKGKWLNNLTGGNTNAGIKA